GDHQHDELRVIDGNEADKGADGRVGQIFSVFGDARGPGLAGDAVLEAVDAGGETGAVLDHLDHHLLHLLRGLCADDLADDPRRNRVVDPVGVDHLVHDVRPDEVAAAGGHVDGGQHLDWRGIDPLAEGGRGELDRLPLGEVAERLGGLRRDVDTGGGANAELLQVLVEGGSALHLLRLDGADVERVLQHLRHGDVPMRPVVPVADRYPADDGDTGLVEARVRRDRVVVERAGQGHDLHYRPGLVETRDDRVDELGGRRRRKLVRVVAGHVRPGDDATGGWLHDDQRATLRLVLLDAVGQRPFGDHLDGAVKRQLERHAVDRIAALAIAEHDRPVRQVAHRCLESRLARQRLVVKAFDAVVALPLVVGEAQQVG